MFKKLATISQFHELLFALTYRAIKPTTKQALVGYGWVVVQPLLTAGLLSFIFRDLLGLNLESNGLPYALFVLCGMIPWQYFMSSLLESVDSLVRNQLLITQVALPRELLVFYSLLAKLVDFVLAFAVLMLALLVAGVPVHLTGLWVLALLPIQMILAFALGLLLAPINVMFRDVSRLMHLLMGFIFYTVPVIYPVSQVSPAWQKLYLLNPLAVIIDTFRNTLLLGHRPDFLYLGLAFAISVSLLVVAFRIFQLYEGILADLV